MQAFSAAVKEEILNGLNSRGRCDACLLGMLVFCRQLSQDEISILTESRHTAEFFVRNLSRAACCEVSLEELKRSGRYVYSAALTDKRAISSVYEYFGFEKCGGRQKLSEKLMPKRKYYPQVAAGAFLVCGSVNDPMKRSHMEFVLPNLELCNELGLMLIEECSVTAKQTVRGNKQVVYLKDSESIQDLLIYIGASGSALKHITVKVDKEGSNRINRSINCTCANMKKSEAASEKQIEAIRALICDERLYTLSDDMIDVAQKRLENPDLPLSELCCIVEPRVSKSTLGRKLNRLVELAGI